MRIFAFSGDIFTHTNDKRLQFQQVCKKYFDENVKCTIRFKPCDIVYVDQRQLEAKTAKEKELGIAHSKLRPRTTSHFNVVRAYGDYVYILDANMH